MVVYSCHPNTWDTWDTGGLVVQDQSCLYNKVEASLGYMKPDSKLPQEPTRRLGGSRCLPASKSDFQDPHATLTSCPLISTRKRSQAASSTCNKN